VHNGERERKETVHNGEREREKTVHNGEQEREERCAQRGAGERMCTSVSKNHGNTAGNPATESPLAQGALLLATPVSLLVGVETVTLMVGVAAYPR